MISLFSAILLAAIDVTNLGAVGDGLSHPISDTCPDLACVYSTYPELDPNNGGPGVALSDETNWVAIQTALIRAHDTVDTVEIPRGIYLFNRQLTNRTLVPIVTVGELRFSGSGEHAFVFGSEDGDSVVYKSALQSSLRVVRNSVDWDDKYAGVVLANAHRMLLTVEVWYFDVGFLMYAKKGGAASNIITIQRLYGNRVGQRLHTTRDSPGSYGFINSNTFICGEISYAGSYGSHDEPTHAIEIMTDMEAGESHYPNGNVWLNPELSNRNIYGWSSAIHGSGVCFVEPCTAPVFSENIILGFRYESLDFLLSGKGITGNEFRYSRGGPRATASHTLLNPDSAAERLVLIQNDIRGPAASISFRGQAVEVASWRADDLEVLGTDISAPDKGAFYTSTGTYVQQYGYPVQDGALIVNTLAAFPGVMFDLREETNDFLRRMDLKVFASAGRVAVVAYKWDGTAFVESTAAEDVNLTYKTSWGHFLGVSDFNAARREYTLTFASDVDLVFVGVARGSNSADVKEMRYYVPGQSDIRRVDVDTVN